VRKTWIVVASVAVIVFVAWYRGWFSGEPKYQGTTVTQWLDAMAYANGPFVPGEPNTDPALQAVKAIGRAAVPVCVSHLETGREPSPLRRRWLMARAAVEGRFKSQRTVQVWPPRFPDNTVKRWTCATAALICLGPDRGAGVPKIIETVLAAPLARPAAVNAFFLTGTSEPSTLPALLAGLKDSRLPARQFCAEAVSRMAPWVPPTVISTLTNAVSDPDPMVRAYVIGTLGSAGKGDFDVAQLLVNVLTNSPDANTRLAAVRALDDLEATASVVIDALARAKSDGDRFVAAQAITTFDRLKKVHEDRSE